jgi:hypothetical protein
MVEILQLGYFLCQWWITSVKVPQVIHCMLCHDRTIGHVILEQIIKLRKGFVSYFKTNGIIVFKTHVDANYD